MKLFKRKVAVVLAMALLISSIPINQVLATDIIEAEITDAEIVENKEALEEGIKSDASLSVEIEEIEEVEEVDAEQDLGQRLNYVYVESPYLETPSVQNIVVSWGDGTEDIKDMRIVLKNSRGIEEEWASTKKIGKLHLFTKEYNESIKDEYEVTKIRFVQEGAEQEHILAEINDVSVNFGVNKEYEGYGENIVSLTKENDSSVGEDVEATIVNLEENGEAETVNDIAEALTAAEGELEMAPMQAESRTGVRRNETVIVLDPGHDATHAGATGNGLREEVLTLKIAKYAKTKLEEWGQARIYMVRDSACPYPGTTSGDCNAKRVEAAKEQGATIYVSFHLNSSTSSAAAGAEVIHPSKNWKPEIGMEGEALAKAIQKELVALGLKDRGIYSKSREISTYPDGSYQDWYQIPRLCKESGFPGIIIEHAFISSGNDANKFLKTEAGLRKLGEADAAGIIKYIEATGKWAIKDGKQYYSVGGKLVKGERKIDGKWYYFDENDGVMQTGVVELPGKTVCYAPTGEMAYGEQKIDGKWYYFKPGNGAMQKATFVQLPGKRVYYDEAGQMVYGKQYINEKEFYFEPGNGRQKIGKHKTDKGIVCYLENGGYGYGEQWLENSWYHFDEKTALMTTGIKELSGKTVYYNETGEMHYGEKKMDGKWYYFKPGNGAMQKETFVQLPGKRVYYDEAGQMVYGKQSINGKEFYFEPGNGKQKIGKCKTDKGIVCYLENGGYGYGEQWLENSWYHFDEKTGLMTNGIKELSGKTVYYNEMGEMHYGEKKIDGNWYYFKPGNGAMQKATFVQLPGKRVYYDESGVMLYGEQRIKGQWYYLKEGTGKMMTNVWKNGHYYNAQGIRR